MEKYIQLPPIPEELDGNVVRLIWEYAKLPEKEQQFIYEQYKVLSDDSRSEYSLDNWTCCRFYLRLRVQYIERSI